MSKPADDDEGMGAMWRAIRAEGQRKRAHNRAASSGLLASAGIQFESKNDGAHLIVTAGDSTVVDFWPGTGLWILRNSVKQLRRRGVGVRALLAFCADHQG